MQMSFPSSRPPSHEDGGRCLLSGATGYLGGRIKEKLTLEGWLVIDLARNPKADSKAIRFKLGEPIDPERLRNCTALIHCAYDFTKTSWKEIYSINVHGSELLLRAAHQAGVKRLVFISTISAFDGCRSFYGKGKLEVERIARSLGACVIRPGLVHGPNPGGMFGRLVANVKRSRIIPLPGTGTQPMYLVHEADIAESVFQSIRMVDGVSSTPITVAHEQPWSFRAILLALARAMERDVLFLPVPWRLMWAPLRLAEILRIPTGFRSDSLVSLVNQNPKPNLNAFEAVGVSCRPFQATVLANP
jgi:nucleoside-diphosphate-sugar epimerase